MKTFTLRNTVAVVILAGAGLSGCAGDPFYDNTSYSQGYNQPVYSQRYYDTNAQGNYYGPNYTNAQGNYYGPNYQNRPYYTDRPYYYQTR